MNICDECKKEIKEEEDCCKVTQFKEVFESAIFCNMKCLKNWINND